jgi:hypothetical protein
VIRIGVTGHRVIPEELYGHVRDALRAAVCGRARPVRALSSLAPGADQMFAEIALDCGASLTVVTPSHDYEDAFHHPADLARYRGLRDRASDEITLDFPVVCDQAYYDAGAYIADHSDLVVAVWDGRPSRGLGGTADMVAYARKIGRTVSVIWKDGVERP